MENNKTQRAVRDYYDIIIVGGGIYGAALLWEATLRGLTAILVEKSDFGGATSANSLKIIHGGLRYLQNLDIKRIRESVTERKILMRIAPHLVHPITCVTPTYNNLKEGRLTFKLALSVNDLLSFDRNIGSFPEKRIRSCRIIPAEECERMIPGLDVTHVTGGAVWHDARVYNSERLVLSFILSACNRGAHAYNYMEMKKLIVRNRKVAGIIAHDSLTDQEVEILGKITVNNTGPWINEFYKHFTSGSSSRSFGFAKAVNIIVPRKISDYAIGLKTAETGNCKRPQSRLIFFVPWRETTMTGTWYFPEQTSPDEIRLKESELSSCITDIQKTFPAANITFDDISFVHVGMVPLEGSTGHGERPEIAKHYKIMDHSHMHGPSGIISVLGVKYTTARDVAVRTIDLISKKLGLKLNHLSSKNEPLDGGDIPNYQSLLKDAADNNPFELLTKSINHMITNYGTKYKEIQSRISVNKSLAEFIPGSDEVIKAEVVYSVRNEFAYSLSDLLLRRTDLGTFKRPMNETVASCATMMAEELGWDERQKQSEIRSFQKTYDWLN